MNSIKQIEVIYADKLVGRLVCILTILPPHSYDVDPREEGMAFKEQFLFCFPLFFIRVKNDIS